MKPRLRRYIAMNRRTSEDPGDRAGIDDTAMTARHHDACRLAGKSEARGEIGGEDPLEIAILPFRERAAMLDSCIVDEDIELAMPVDDIGDGSRAGLGIANIESGEFGVGYLGCGASQCFRIATIEHHLRAMLGQCLGDCQAKPARGPRHQRNPSLKGETVDHLLLSAKNAFSRPTSSSRLNLLGDADVRRLRRAT